MAGRELPEWFERVVAVSDWVLLAAFVVLTALLVMNLLAVV